MDQKQQQEQHEQQHLQASHTSFNDFPKPLPAVAPPGPEASVPKKRRSQVSLAACCTVCRLRKVKCSGRPAVGSKCNTCLRLDFECSFVDTAEGPPLDIGAARKTPSRSHTEAGTARKRAQRACTNCHAHKTKCSGDQPRCKRCEGANLSCEYVAAKRKFTSAPVNLPGTTSTSFSLPPKSEHSATEEDTFGNVDDPVPNNAGVQGPDAPGSPELPSEALSRRVRDMEEWANQSILHKKDFIKPHIDAFFKNLSHLPCLSFFHKDTLYRDLEEGKISPSLAAAICSVTAFFLLPQEACTDFAVNCSRQVEFQLFRNVGSLNESHIILYSLAIVHNLLLGKSAKCWQMVALASRNMVGLQLNWDVPGSTKSFMEQECLRRVTWHIFHMDRLCADGFDAYVCCRENDMKIRLPCNQAAFENNTPVSAERLTEISANGVTPPMSPQSYCIRLINLRHHLLGVTKRLCGGTAKVHGVKAEASHVMAEVQRLQKEIAELQASLPADLRLVEANIARWAGTPEEQSFVYIHSWICTLHIELYQFALPGLEETGSPELLRKLPQKFIIQGQKQATAFAITVARFWKKFEARSKINRDPYAPTYLGDIFMMPCIQRCTKALMAAVNHKLYHNLSDHSTAPLDRDARVDVKILRGLIQDTLAFIRPLANSIKSMGMKLSELQKEVDKFEEEQGPPLVEPQKSPTAASASSASTDALPTLPGPNFMLKSPCTFDVPVRSGAVSQPLMDANVMMNWVSHVSSDPTCQDIYGSLAGGSNTELDPEFFPPGMPLLLADARGIPGASDWPFAPPLDMNEMEAGQITSRSIGPKLSLSDGNDEVALMYMQQLNNEGIQGPMQHPSRAPHPLLHSQHPHTTPHPHSHAPQGHLQHMNPHAHIHQAHHGPHPSHVTQPIHHGHPPPPGPPPPGLLGTVSYVLQHPPSGNVAGPGVPPPPIPGQHSVIFPSGGYGRYNTNV